MKLALALVLVGVAGLAVLGQGPASETYWVTNPTSEARLYVAVVRPHAAPPVPLPALVLVPGGSGDSSGFVRSTPDGSSQALRLADRGFVVVAFDADGRGRSRGTENDNGYVHQDGLAEVIRFAASLSGVDPARIGLVSYSYGVTMAAGALARHPDLSVLFYIDWEGPANRDDTGGCDEHRVGHLQGHACDDEAFWQEREAATFALSLRVPYQRLQAREDHVQPDVDHALLMLRNATAVEHGGNGICPWTRLNDLPENTVYTEATLPPLPPAGTQQREIADYALDLLARFAPLSAG